MSSLRAVRNSMKNLELQILPKIKNFSFKKFYPSIKTGINFLYHVIV